MSSCLILTIEVDDGYDVSDVVVGGGSLPGKPGYSTRSSCLMEMDHLASLAEGSFCLAEGVG